ncbi:MAG: type I-F CRISPR-associated protein Csy1, partial [Comamonas sp.]|nr:type I-F CRISPR-associated protein Csy1 [Candidatus Comamonas equi]
NEANQTALEAKKKRNFHANVFHEYKGIAKLQLGGAHPKNVSYLNQMRGGVNYLLSSLPPVWKASAVRLPMRASSIFDRLFIARPEVRETVRAMRQFLESDPPPNIDTRERRESYTDALIDELVSCAGELQQLVQPGWTKDDARFKDLAHEEQLWLDPLRAELPDQSEFAQEWLRMEWPAEIGKRFGRWLNAQLQNRLPVGDVEARFWAKELLTDEDGFKQQLRDLRRKLDGKAVAA